MKILYYDAISYPAVETELKASIVPKETVFSDSNFISVNLPFLPETRHFVNEELIRLMKPTAFLALDDPDPTGTHIHSYAETSVHPDSIEAIMKSYFWLMGRPSSRKIDHMAPKAGMAACTALSPRVAPTLTTSGFSTKMRDCAP